MHNILIVIHTFVGCPPGFEYFPEVNRCYRVVLESLNWAQSRDRCLAIDTRSRLVVITSEAENSAIVEYLQSLSGQGEFTTSGGNGTLKYYAIIFIC